MSAFVRFVTLFEAEQVSRTRVSTTAAAAAAATATTIYATWHQQLGSFRNRWFVCAVRVSGKILSARVILRSMFEKLLTPTSKYFFSVRVFG